jgi:predicted O-methyltransferase YrrM
MKLKNIYKRIIRMLPYVKTLYKQSMQSCYPNGHYYSPVFSIEDIKKRECQIWKNSLIDGVQGIDLKTSEQFALVKKIETYYKDMPFTTKKNNEQRYYFENNYYSYTDGIILYSMIRHFKPKQIIEVGSGFSSMVMLDTNELFFENQIKCTFIEPYPERLDSLMKSSDKVLATIIERNIQDISLDFFSQLESGDILFIDSTHVSKTGSDVNYIIFEILPILKTGVLIHFHDVFYPFEYPKEWVYSGINWNEDFILRAFLMYNREFEIVLFSKYLLELHFTIFQSMPLCSKSSGSSFWIRKCDEPLNIITKYD